MKAHAQIWELELDTMAAHAEATSSFKLALIQLAVGSDKATNLSRAAEKVREAAQNGSKIVALPVSDCDYIRENMTMMAIVCA